MIGKIYKITNNINNKIYIGQTIQTLKARFYKHCIDSQQEDKYHKNMAIKKAIFKYGKENFSIELIEEVEKSMLDEREKYWISYYDSYNKGYNCTLGGQNGATRKCSLTESEEENVIYGKLMGFSSTEIANIYNIDKGTVKNIFKRHNIEMPINRILSGRINKEDFINFLSTNPTIKQIEEKFSICRSSVFNYMKRNHIEYNFSTSART